jgi:hypothetical protein
MGAWRDGDLVSAERPRHAFAVEAAAAQPRHPETSVGGALVVRCDQPGIYNGAGLFIVNPPYAFTQALPPLLEALRAALAPEGHKGEIAADWLGDSSNNQLPVCGTAWG